MSSAHANEHFPGGRLLNDAVRTALAAEGDDGRTVRKVEHFAYPQGFFSRFKKPAVAEALAEKGFNIRDAHSAGGLIFSHEVSVSSESFDALTLELFTLMPEYNWVYDGWESIVLRSTE